ncbi:MAG: GIY-YIG nuclease family protein [Oscillospiraceae bacterium]|nr:GIY-YIG nuclease family protein [Oscillospiraceae bacterium]
MCIYKITNKINNKVYIGQTTKTVEERWKRHCNDALSGRLKTKFASAIRKYGVESFQVEKIDTAKTKNELNKKEAYWISFYNSVYNGYNSTDGGENTNTYRHKTEEEMDTIKEKIRLTKTGRLNPHAQKIKCKNVYTYEELVFDTFVDCVKHFNESNHSFITRRVLHKTKYLYKKEWLISYFDEEYIQDYSIEKQINRRKEIIVEDLDAHKSICFSSFANAERYFDLPLKTLSGKAYLKGNDFVIRSKYHVIILN